MSLQYGLIALIALAIFAVLSVTVFFNIDTALVIGSSIYTPEEIAAAGNIQGGDNMIRKRLDKAEQDITSQLIYIETAEIKRKLPSSVEITVTPCTETASLEGDDGFMVVSGGGKILRFSEEPAEGTQVYYGAEPAEGLETGMTFASADEGKTEVIFALMGLLSESPFASEITSYDVRDRLNISCVYDGRVDIELGVVTDAEYKFKMANKILTEKVSPEFEGRLKLFGEAGQLLSNDDLKQNDEIYEHNITSVSETTAVETDGTGEETNAETSEETVSSKLNFE